MKLVDSIDTKALLEQIAALTKANEELRVAHASAASKGIGMKVSEKGAVSVYGIGRFPVTLYRTQWEALFGRIEDLKKFISENETRLASKPVAKPKAA